MKLNKTIQKIKDLMESKIYLDTHDTKRSSLIHDGLFTNNGGDIVKDAIQDQLKLITCEEDFKLLDRMMYSCGYGHTMWTKRSSRHVISVSTYGWEEIVPCRMYGTKWEVQLDPTRCTYIADGDDRRRKCLWKNLWRNILISI